MVVFHKCDRYWVVDDGCPGVFSPWALWREATTHTTPTKGTSSARTTDAPRPSHLGRGDPARIADKLAEGTA